MKITENKLLSGYDGISNDGITAQSIINGERIWWTYRQGQDNEGYNVVTEKRSEAAEIHLANSRHGIIPLAKRLTKKQEAQALEHEKLCRSVWGDEI